MSLNKFTDTATGLDIGLKIGADVLKCNSLEVLTDAKIAGVPTTVTTTNVIAAPVFNIGSASLVYNASVHEKQTLASGEVVSKISGAFLFNNTLGVLDGTAYQVQFDITPPELPSYPAEGFYVPGCVASCIDDTTVGHSVLNSCVSATMVGGKIRVDILTNINISGVASLRNTSIHYDFVYTHTPA